jgi:hypothetical protein
MSEARSIQCQTCEQILGNSHRMFGYLWNQISYELAGETPSDQAVMKLRALSTLARFCSSDCCKQQLPGLLQAQGLAAHLQHNRVGGGPIAPCGQCGKPVDMSQPHGAWIKGKVTADIQNGEDDLPDWMDVLTVVCTSCGGPHTADALALSKRPSSPFEQLLLELAALDEQADDGLEIGDPFTEREPICGA